MYWQRHLSDLCWLYTPAVVLKKVKLLQKREVLAMKTVNLKLISSDDSFMQKTFSDNYIPDL